MLWKMFRRFDDIVTTVAVLKYDVVWPCICSDMTDDSFDGKVFFVLVM